MYRQLPLIFIAAWLLTANGNAQKSILRLDQPTLMHEVRETPSPLDGKRSALNPPRFMWPDKYPHLGAVLDGVEGKDFKPEVTYRIRIARDPEFKTHVITAERNWAFFNPYQLFEKGTWYWQHAYVDKDGKEEWSPVYKFFIDDVITAERNWAFFNPYQLFEKGTWYWQHAYVDKDGKEEWSPVYKFFIDDQTRTFNPPSLQEPYQLFEKGTWYWQHAYVDKDGKEEWSPVYKFFIDDQTRTFNPPSLQEVLKKLPKTHPRILLDAADWDHIIARNKQNPEAKQYITKAQKCLSRPLKHLEEEIDTTKVVKLTNIVQYRSALIRESRKIVDREEANIEAMVRAYLLTKDEVYYKEGMKRLSEILSWEDSKYFAGDFNRSTILSMSTAAYDAWYNLLTPAEKQLLLKTIRDNGKKFYHEYVNHLENRIADNHVWPLKTALPTTMCGR